MAIHSRRLDALLARSERKKRTKTHVVAAFAASLRFCFEARWKCTLCILVHIDVGNDIALLETGSNKSRAPEMEFSMSRFPADHAWKDVEPSAKAIRIAQSQHGQSPLCSKIAMATLICFGLLL